ncbi:hypothetical protein O181_107711 [Austropuccinia psidii MF-1]|uniref:Tet-like 2OG-Fe(II) oxygenase domain-containing protein n=1 Tax=Austropuccinia psidii MF-1 TaxID=1389203 RepID=A0A9Q3PPD1_9BASI|nr:hypothetical protein [Austropuccinia psidii MF-1]
MTPSEIWRVVDVNQIKRIHFGRVAIFSSTGLLIALVEFRPFTTMSEVKVNQWDELSQFLFCEKRFTNLIATNGALLEGFMFAIGWRKCSTKNEQFGLYGSVGKIEKAKDEWRNQGANLSLACAGSSNAKSSLRLCRLPTLHTQSFRLVQAPDNSKKLLRRFRLPTPPMEFLTFCRFPTIQAIPCACAGSDNAKNSLHLCRHPTIHTRILTLVKVPNNARNSLHLCRLPIIHMPILTLVKVPDNAKNSLHLCRLPTIHTPILTLVKVPKNAKNSLHLCRLPTIHTPILTLVKVPKNAENFLRLCRLPTIHTPILTLVKFPDNAKTSLHLCRLPTIHMPVLTLVKVPDNFNNSIHD